MKAVFLSVLSTFFTLMACAANATCEILDSIKYQGEILTIGKNTNLPSSGEYLSWIASLPDCSAGNQGRARYKINNNAIYLIGFSSCGQSSPKVSDIYPKLSYPRPSDEMKAAWLNGEIQAFGGGHACMLSNCSVEKIQYTFLVSKGNIQSVMSAPNPAAEICSKRLPEPNKR